MAPLTLHLLLAADSYDASAGALTPIQTVSSLPTDYTEGGAAARLVIHPSGKWVLCANRGHQSLATFAIDEASGRIEYRGTTPVDATPRAFHFTPDGRHLYSAGEQTNTIRHFAFDGETGDLSLIKTYGTGRKISDGFESISFRAKQPRDRRCVRAGHPWWVEVVDVPEDAKL